MFSIAWGIQFLLFLTRYNFKYFEGLTLVYPYTVEVRNKRLLQQLWCQCETAGGAAGVGGASVQPAVGEGSACALAAVTARPLRAQEAWTAQDAR